MDLNNIINNFDYKDKGLGEAIYDAIISPACYALGGKTITCLNKETGSLIDSKAAKNKDVNIEFQSSRNKTGMLHGFGRLLAGAFAIATSPIIALALIGKAVSANSKSLSERIISKQSGDTLNQKDRVSSSIWGQFVEGIAKKFISYGDLKKAAHIQADAQLSNPYYDNLKDYEGGLFFASATMLREELEKQQNQPQFGTDVKKALKIANEYEQWSYKMASIMPSRFLPGDPNTKDLQEDLRDRINNLKLGEAFLVPVNLKTNNSGSFHTITAQIKLEEDGAQGKKYSLIIYNVGLGCDNHEITTDAKGKRSAYPFRLGNISADKMTDPSILKQFIDLATFKEMDKDGSKFYGFLKDKKIWGDNVEVNPKAADLVADPVTPRTLQRSGTCIWKSALTAIRGNMPLESYKAFVFAMKRDNINSIYQKYLEGKAPKPQSKKKGTELHAHVLVKIGIDEFQERIKKNKARFADPARDEVDSNAFKKILANLQKTDAIETQKLIDQGVSLPPPPRHRQGPNINA